jgi:tetratricopeptide (TPR) repeat protein
MAFNRTKAIESAQRFANQGKLAQAISQYQEVLRRDPRDQTTLMTLGDLYVTAGDVPHAVEQFERLGQLFLSEGFTSKAIAVYKKIAKLQPAGVEPLARLADLYAQQGVMSEARPLYLQVAEAQIRAKQTEAAIKTLHRLLELEPENLRVQTRLADLYLSLGRHAEAAKAFLVGAQRMYDHGNLTEAERLAGKALEVDPGSAAAAALRGRALAGLGRAAEAVALLEKLPEPGPEVSSLLVEIHLAQGQPAKAAARARQAFAARPEQAPLVLDVALAMIEAGDAEGALELLGEIREALTRLGDYDRLARALGLLVDRMPGRIEPLEWLAEVGRRSGDSLRLNGALDGLAAALEAAGDDAAAARALEELFERTGGDEQVRRRFNAVRERLGQEPVTEPAGIHAAFSRLPSPAVAAGNEPEMDAETRAFVSQALTDVDLYSSYGMTPKAIALLETVVARVPGHIGATEKLLDLAVAAGDDARTVALAFQLEKLHRARGDAARAEHYAELCRRYRRVTGITPPEDAEVAAPAAPEAPEPVAEFELAAADAEPAAAELPAPQASEAPAPPPAEPVAPVEAGEAAVYEVDLSAEWAAMASETHPAREADAPEAAIELVEPETEEAPAEAAPPAAAEPVATAPAEAAPPAEAPEEEAVEYELEPVPAEPAAAPAGSGMTASEFLAELGAEVEEFTEAVSAPAGGAPPAEPEPAIAARSQAPADESVAQLREVFEEFRSELGGLTDEDEDLEKHYNLGIAYREMGLLEEAIGEFQRVAKSVGKGRPFRYAMQCCTLLGLCFFEKGQPKVAALWYRRALETPGLDPESVMALRYDLGVALEQAGEAGEALDSFLQVYAMNIDYRDVAERIAALDRRPGR